jgi:type I restriction enzyme S subunit
MKILSLSEFCKTGSGGTPSRSKRSEYYDGGTIPWVKSGELAQIFVESTEEFITEKGLSESSAKLIEPGAILMAMYGATVGQVSQLAIPAATNQAVCHIYPDPKVCDRNYIFRVLRGVKNELLSKRVGGGQPNISQKIIRDLKIPLPLLEEQKRIAGILDAADRLRAQRRETLAQIDTLLQSTFLELFGDPVTNPKGWEVGVIGDLLVSANYGTSKKAALVKGAYPVLRMNNITYSGGWDFKSLKYMDLEEKELSKHLVHRGQILFNRTNSKELVGKTAVYRRNEPMAFAGYLVRGITNEFADPEYIGAYMNLPQTKQRLQNMCKNIVGMANINAKEFQEIPIQKPPLDLQRRFAAIVESVENQKARQRAHLAELDALFASLQSRAFNGEL